MVPLIIKKVIMDQADFPSHNIIRSLLIDEPLNTLFQSSKSNNVPAPFYFPPGEPLQPGPRNVDIRTIIRSEQTGGQLSNVEVAVGPKQMGPSPHLHKNLDELMYVLEGTATVLIGDEIFEVKAGGWNFRPRGIVHCFWNASDTGLRFLDFFFNQNFEHYLEELFHSILPHMIHHNLTPEIPEISNRITALDEMFGVTWFHHQRQAIIEKYDLRD
jgi:mannose-6-phosphate isomerase-like protein (cupin superfamily)